MNHVLAQIYHNVGADPQHGCRHASKAAISRHSDKTKDMPAHGVMAFVTLYSDPDGRLQPLQQRTPQGGAPDYGRCSAKGSALSGLTRLRFCLKPDARLEAGPHAAEVVDVALQPNSLLLVPLRTNRLYTHEIR